MTKRESHSNPMLCAGQDRNTSLASAAVNNNDGREKLAAPVLVSSCAAFLRPKAVTAHYGIHRSSLYRALAEGKIKAVKAGRTVLIDGDSLRAYLASLPKAEFKAP
jgi:excisionase family DNA binding protein